MSRPKPPVRHWRSCLKRLPPTKRCALWIPVTGSKESIEWAAAHNFPITPGLAGSLGFRQDMVRYYAKCLSEVGHTITPDHLIVGVNAYVADSREAAFDESGEYQLYFNRPLFSHGNVLETDQQRRDGYLSENAYDYVTPENRVVTARTRTHLGQMTLADLKKDQNLAWGRADEVTAKLIGYADAIGCNTLLVSLNRGSMPSDLFKAQIRRFAKEVLPALQAHEVKQVGPVMG